MITSTMQNISDSKKVKSSKGSVKRKAQSRAAVKRTKKNADGIATSLYRQGRDAVSNAYDSATKAGSRASRSLPHLPSDLRLRARSQSLYNVMEDRPIIAGAVGLGIGMVLAALLPSFSSDHRKH